MLQIGIFSKLNRRFCVSNYLVTLVVSQSHSMSDVVSDHQRSFQDWFCRMEDVGHLLMNTMTSLCSQIHGNIYSSQSKLRVKFSGLTEMFIEIWLVLLKPI